MSRLRPYRHDLWAVLGLLGVALLWFAPVLLPSLIGLTLLPYDNLYTFQPWRAMQPGVVPHNELLSDLVLQNAVWKLHIRAALADGQIPLWNPQLFTGQPFLAAGQASVFYPLSVLFYVLPVNVAYGWFTALQVALAGINMYIFVRVLGLRRPAALVGGVVYMFSGFLIVSVVFTMFLAAVPWLPLILAVIEIIIRKQEEKGAVAYSPIPYVTLGALAIGVMILAGHPELIYYTLLVAGAYSLVRLAGAWWMMRRLKIEDWVDGRSASSDDLGSTHSSIFIPQSALSVVVRLGLWLLAMAVLGVALGAVQLIPLLEVLPMNFREGSAGLTQVREWAWPTRHILTFPLPNVFGNPSHHAWFDIWARTLEPATVNAHGQAINTIFWGIKNYVEGGNYLGIATWVLAALGALYGVSNRQSALFGAKSSQRSAPLAPRPLHTWFFLGLAVIALLFAFGTPLYAVLFYGLPGWNQLHSPFRAVFPFTLSMAVLAAAGVEALLRIARADAAPRGGWLRPAAKILAALAMTAGVGALALVGASVVQPDRFVALGQRLVDGSDLAQNAFADGRMFWSYQAGNLFWFGVFALLAGALVWWGQKPNGKWETTRSQWFIGIALATVIVLDLWVAHGRFNPAAHVTLDPRTPTGTPPVVDFVNGREGLDASPPAPRPSLPASPWRFTTFNMPGEKTFNANVGMYYGWQDIRGYDSIIPRQYVAFMNRIAPQENELLYNRVAPLYSNVTGDPYAILDNPLLDLLNVKYVLTEHYIPNPTWAEVYRDASIGVYENREVMPRAFIVPEALVVPVDAQPLTAADLRTTVFLDETPVEDNALTRASPELADARISRYTAEDVFVDVNLSDRGWLVLTDAYFPGWKAFIRPFGAGENQEQELRIYRANGTFRAVYLPDDGQWTVRFVYSPMSFKLGLYVSFLALMTLALLGLYWLWGKYYRPEASAGDVRTVAKNSLVPMTLSLANKAIDFAFAMLYVRILGPEGTGKYYFVVALYGFFEIISRYGLGTLLTRDVAADKNQSSRYLTNVIALRTLLWALTMPVLALVTWFYATLGTRGALTGVENIGRQEIQAIAILGLAMLFANWADALSSSFNAFEKMEYPAGLASAMAILKVTLGALVLLAGFGFVGLAGVSLVSNVVQVVWLFLLLRVTLFRPQWHWDGALQRQMFRLSGPLMLNHLLATIFWRIDVWILRPLAGAAGVGLYSVGLKYLDGLNIIPSVFTMAVFPLMSRYARSDADNLLRSYRVSVRLLVMVSLPIAMAVTFLAEPLVWLVGGAQYLNVPETLTFLGRTVTISGGADLAMQVIIWSIPIGFVNSVTQYVLISVNQQHFLTRAFILGVLFNTVGNLLLIPGLGYLGAAFVTILSEFSLLFPFYYSVRRHVGVLPWARIFVPPALSVIAMGLAAWALMRMGVNVWLATGSGLVIYLLALGLTGALRGDDMALVVGKLPLGPLRRLVAGSA